MRQILIDLEASKPEEKVKFMVENEVEPQALSFLYTESRGKLFSKEGVEFDEMIEAAFDAGFTMASSFGVVSQVSLVFV